MYRVMSPSQFRVGFRGLCCSLALMLFGGCGGGGGSDDSTDTTDTTESTLVGSTFIGEYYSGSGNCSVCHDGITDSNGNDLSIVTAWSTSMMANAARDPYWQAKIASELKRTPLQADFLNDACSRCHAPMANDSANKDGVDPQILDEGFLDPDNAYHDPAVDGVSCSLCHQITETGSESGEYVVDIYTNKVDRPAFGGYLDPIQEPMQVNVEFTPQQGTHMGTSEFCGHCHDLRTPILDDTGVATGDYFPEQMAYSEWESSDFQTGGSLEKPCQGCHMPEVDGVVISVLPVWLTARDQFNRHDMLAANTLMQEILDANRDALGVTAQGFDQAIERNRAFLQTAATVEIISPVLDSGELTLDVKVTNLSGHKLPTAYPSRRMFIHLLVEDADTGAVLFESGKLNSDGSIVGDALDSNPLTYEPHYDEISDQSQVQVYEPIMKGLDGSVTHTLLRATGYLKDNRIPPSGFDKLAVSDDVAVLGLALNDADFIGGSDSVTYRVSAGASTNLKVTAELKYQTLSFGHLQNLFEDSDLPEVASFKTMFDSATIRSETIATAIVTL